MNISNSVSCGCVRLQRIDSSNYWLYDVNCNITIQKSHDRYCTLVPHPDTDDTYMLKKIPLAEVYNICESEYLPRLNIYRNCFLGSWLRITHQLSVQSAYTIRTCCFKSSMEMKLNWHWNNIKLLLIKIIFVMFDSLAWNFNSNVWAYVMKV